MKECSTPPSEAVLWEVYERAGTAEFPPRHELLSGHILAKGAFEAWRASRVPTGYGACWVANLWTPAAKLFKKPPTKLTEAQKRNRAREAIFPRAQDNSAKNG